MRVRAWSDEGRNLRSYRSVVEEAVMAAHVLDHNLKVRHLMQRVGDSPELTAARVSTWLVFG